MSANRVPRENAVLNRAKEGGGGYTYNSFPPEDYDGPVLVIAALKLGEHAHLDVETGRQIPQPARNFPQLRRGRAGHLVLAWRDWLWFRDVVLERHECVRIAEVEQPTAGQLEAQHVNDAEAHYARGYEAGWAAALDARDAEDAAGVGS